MNIERLPKPRRQPRTDVPGLRSDNPVVTLVLHYRRYGWTHSQFDWANLRQWFNFTNDPLPG